MDNRTDNQQQEYNRHQDNLIAAIFSHHRVVLEKIVRQEYPSEEDRRVYELKKFLDSEHQAQLEMLLSNISLTRMESSLSQPEIVEHLVAYIREKINLTQLLAQLGQRSLPAIIEMLNESSREALSAYVKKRFDKRHFYTLSAEVAKQKLVGSATGALTLGGALSLATGSGIFLAPVALATLVFSGLGQIKHNITTMVRCLLIAKELNLDLLEVTKDIAETPPKNDTSAAKEAPQAIYPYSLPPSNGPTTLSTGTNSIDSLRHLFWTRHKQPKNEAKEIEVEMQPMNHYR